VPGTDAEIFSQYAGTDSVSANAPVIGTLGTNKVGINNVSVYPNPTRNLITISTNSIFKSVSVYDISGKTVKSYSETKILDVSDLSNGMYFLKTNTGLQAKFIKL